MTCSLPECNNPKYQRGWCRAHYLRWYKYGDPRFLKGRTPWNKGKTGIYSEETLKKISENNARSNLGKTGELNPNWKGAKAKYQAVHKWVRENFGMPETCEYCGKTGLRSHHINWANISKTYQRIRSDWIRLCRSCHTRFDRGSISIYEMLNILFAKEKTQ